MMKKDTKEKFAQALARAGVLFLLFSISGCAQLETAYDTAADKLPTALGAGIGFAVGGPVGGMVGAATGDLLSDAVEAKLDVELLEQTAELVRQDSTSEADIFKDTIRELEANVKEAERVKTTMDLIIAAWPWLVMAAVAIAALLYFLQPPFQNKKSPKGK